MNKDSEAKNIHSGHRERVRKRFLKDGISSFSDYQILEMLMFYVHKRKDTNEIGHNLINEFGSLENVFSATFDELCTVDGVGESGAVLIRLIGQLFNRVNARPIETGTYLSSTEITGQYLIDYFKNLSVERFVLISMNCERKILGVDIISEGDHSATAVDIRKIVNIAMKRKATVVLLAHNHPGDSTNPSDSDIVVTGKIINVLEGLDIMVADHIICNDTSFSSLEERGFLSEGPNYRGRL